MKRITEAQAESKRDKAVEFLRRIGNDSAADEFEAMSAAEYAEHKGVQLTESNPKRKICNMAIRTKTKADLQAELAEANDKIEDLEDKISTIAGVLDGEDDDDEDDE